MFLQLLFIGTAPDYWDDMPQGVTLHIVTLDSKSQEYQEVLQSFEATMRQLNPYPSSTSTAQSTQPATPLAGVGYSSAVPQGVPWPSASTSLQHTFPSSSSTSGSILRRSTQPARRSARQQFPPSTGRSSSIYYSKSSTYNSIIRIQRIQNRVLYSQYAARKKAMEDSNLAGYQIERKLFHGTKPDTCPKVNEQGFNRSFAGANGIFLLLLTGPIGRGRGGGVAPPHFFRFLYCPPPPPPLSYKTNGSAPPL